MGDKTCTPLLGAGASIQSIPLGTRIAAVWAQRYGYPLDDSTNLPRVAQYVEGKHFERDVEAMKRQFIADFLAAAPPLDTSGDDEIHTVLGGYGLPVYVTTNYDHYMSQALWARGRRPVIGISPWYPQPGSALCWWTPDTADDPAPLSDDDSRTYRPTPDRPLVYHLHGYHARPDSLVLTEDDYIEYLIKLSAGLSQSRPLGEARDASIVPAEVRMALSRRSVLFVGYSLRDTTFQVLFRTILRGIEPRYRKPGVSIQVAPPRRAGPDCGCACCDHTGVTAVNRAGQAVNTEAVDFLDAYFREHKITVFWGTAREFAAELRHHAQMAAT